MIDGALLAGPALAFTQVRASKRDPSWTSARFVRAAEISDPKLAA